MLTCCVVLYLLTATLEQDISISNVWSRLSERTQASLTSVCNYHYDVNNVHFVFGFYIIKCILKEKVFPFSLFFWLYSPYLKCVVFLCGLPFILWDVKRALWRDGRSESQCRGQSVRGPWFINHLFFPFAAKHCRYQVSFHSYLWTKIDGCDWKCVENPNNLCCFTPRPRAILILVQKHVNILFKLAAL